MARGRAGGWGPFRLPGERRINERASAEADELMRRLDLLTGEEAEPAQTTDDPASVEQGPAGVADVQAEIASVWASLEEQGNVHRTGRSTYTLTVTPRRPGLDVNAAVDALAAAGFGVTLVASMPELGFGHDPRVVPPFLRPQASEPETDAETDG